MQFKQFIRKKPTLIAIGVLAAAGLSVGAWLVLASREIKVWVYTDYAFRYSHQNWSPLVEARFQEVNRIYQRNGTGVRWKVLDSSQIDPTSNVPGIDARRANMALHFDRQTDIFLILTGVKQGDRTGSANPFTRVAVVIDYPEKSETVNSRILAHQLSHLFGSPNDPGDAKALLNDNPDNEKFSERTVAVIRRMRGYPFELGIDGLSDSSWEKKAFAAVSQEDKAAPVNGVARGHLLLGTTLLNERRMNQALAHFRAAVEADPKSELMHLDLAEAYTRDSQYDKALVEAREAARLAPNDALAHRALGALLGRNGQPEAALQELRAADQMEPTNPQNKVLIGYEYAVMFGHLDDAVSALEEAARVDPNSEMAKKGLEKAQLLKVRVQQAIERGREVVKQHPDDADAHFRLGKAEARAGELKDAIRDFQKAAELRPDNASTHTELAELYLAQGDTSTAWEEVRKARALGSEPAPSLLARLPAQK
jgi:tetratricopeptide (TPR) repeat protein